MNLAKTSIFHFFYHPEEFIPLDKTSTFRFFLTNCYIFHQNVTQHVQSRVRLMAWFLYASVPHRYLCNMHMCSGEKKKGQSTEKRNGRLYSLTVYNRKMIENVVFFFLNCKDNITKHYINSFSRFPEIARGNILFLYKNIYGPGIVKSPC